MFVLKTVLSTFVTLLAACDAPEASHRASAEPSATSPTAATPAPAAPAPAVMDGAAPSAVAPEASGARGDGARAPVAAEKPASKPGKHAGKTIYVCPMHPEVTSDKPGLCPKCNMKLEPKPGAQSASHDQHEHAGHGHGHGGASQ